jgi:hypothetical protein
VIYDAVGNSTKASVTAAADEVGHIQSNGVVTLTLSAAPHGFSRIEITFRRGALPHVSIEESTPTRASWVAPAKTKDDADVYLSGIFSPAQGSDPTYGIDSKGKFVIRSFSNGATTLGATGDVTTDNKKTADPDSFHWAVPLQHVSARNYSAQWSLVGMELNKKANTVNIVSAPSVTATFGHVFLRPDPKFVDVKAIAASIGLDMSAGVEFGRNVRNQYAVANNSSAGQGGFFRIVPAASAFLVVPNVWGLSKISLSSSHIVRIPTSDELFIETRDVTTPIAKLTSDARYYVENTVQFMFTDYAGFKITHKYGSVPPAFNFVQNSGSVGLVIAFKETRVPR